MRKLLSQNNLGIIFVLLYCASSAISPVLGELEQTIHPLKTIFYHFGITILVFNLVNLRHLKKIVPLLSRNKMLVLKLNLSTAAAWIAAYFSLKYLIPSVVLSITFGILPLATIFFLGKEHLSKLQHRDWVLAILLFISILVLSVYQYHWSKMHTPETLSYVVMSLFLCVIGSLGLSLAIVQSKLLNKRGVAPVSILSIRYCVTFLFAFIMLSVTEVSFLFNAHNVPVMIATSLISVIIPTYFLQLGIKFTDPVTVSFFTPFLPVLAYAWQLIHNYVSFTLSLLVITVLISILVFISAVFRAREVAD